MTELDDFRYEKDRFMQTDPQSPLQAEQKQVFEGLQYFPENPGMRLDVSIEPFPEQNITQMQTSTGDIQEYIRYGKFNFLVDGQEAELTIYADSNGYFLPFVDALAGKETYPAGRYLEPIDLGKRKFLIDFNYAYNPYCAYNDYWSCPLTPFENRLKAPIRAGEKIFHE